MLFVLYIRLLYILLCCRLALALSGEKPAVLRIVFKWASVVQATLRVGGLRVIPLLHVLRAIGLVSCLPTNGYLVIDQRTCGGPLVVMKTVAS